MEDDAALLVEVAVEEVDGRVVDVGDDRAPVAAGLADVVVELAAQAVEELVAALVVLGTRPSRSRSRSPRSASRATSRGR